MNKLKFLIYLLFIVGLLVFLKFKENNYFRIPAYNTETTYNAVIEIPAGTNTIIKYIPESNDFSKGSKGQINRLKSLPFPVNVGFIPSTLADTIRNGNGMPLSVMVISESIPTKTTVEISPIGCFNYSDDNVTKILLAQPVSQENQIINVKNMDDFRDIYPVEFHQLENWILNSNLYPGLDSIQWKNEKEAHKEIARWCVE